MSVPEVPPYWRSVIGPPRNGARFARPLLVGLVRSGWRIRVQGRSRVPSTGPVILAANHTGALDGPVVCAVTPRSVHTLVKQEMFGSVVGAALRSLGQIPVDRHHADPGAIKQSLAVLARGDALVLYPEGTRGLGDFGRIQAGVAYFALCTGAPIVPVACLGTRAPGHSPNSVPRPGSVIDVVFGEPIPFDAQPWPRKREVVQDRAERVREWLAEHVRQACTRTGHELPGPVPAAVPEAPARTGCPERFAPEDARTPEDIPSREVTE